MTHGSVVNAVRIENVHKSFGALRAVAGVSITVPQGVICGFLGPNGAGKTTLIRMVMDIIRPDSGHITLLGNVAPGHAKDRVGYLPEERGLYKKMTVRQILIYLGLLKNMRRSAVNAAVTAGLDRLGLANWIDRRVEELSKGMQQKVQFLAATINDPELVILDEPFAGLDPINLDVIKSLMIEMRANGRTVVFSTHMMEQAERLCDVLILVNKGVVVFDGVLDQLQARFPSNSVVIETDDGAEFVAALPEVFSVERQNDRALLITLRDGADSQTLLRREGQDLPEHRRPSAGLAGRRIRGGIRRQGHHRAA